MKEVREADGMEERAEGVVPKWREEYEENRKEVKRETADGW